MPSIGKYLDLSVEHLDRGDIDYLNSCAEPGSTFGLPVSQFTHGWWMWVTNEPECYSDEELPPHLRAICVYAQEHECEYVKFDADGNLNKDLATFTEQQRGFEFNPD